MKLKGIIIISILSFILKNQTYSQTIEIHYHLGYDCSKKINGKEVNGGCVTNEKMKYSLKENGKHFESNILEIQRDIRQYENGNFGKNLEKDSLTVFKFRKKVSLDDFHQLLNFIKLIESFEKEKTDSTLNLKKKVISKWNKNTFELNPSDIRKIRKFRLKENSDLNTDSLIQKITTYIKEKNSGFLISSVVEFLNISFKYKEKEYSISQSNLGEVNVSWQVETDGKMLFVISPKLNKIVDSFIPKKMRAKKKINQFMEIRELKKAF
jgi:hypothetical protein